MIIQKHPRPSSISSNISSIFQQRTTDFDSHKTYLWWKGLCLISTINICLWVWTFFGNAPSADRKPYYRQYHLFFSGIYTFVCAYRSLLPRIDLERYCLFDTPLSSIVLGRSAATIAEISFATQLALFIHEWAVTYHHPYAAVFSFFIPPTLTIAQLFCWMGVITRNHVFHAIEESLWAISFMGIFVVTSVFAYQGYPEIKYIALLGAAMSIGTRSCRRRRRLYVAFMVTVDVPMYLERWRHNTKQNVSSSKSNTKVSGIVAETTSSWMSGFRDALLRRHVTQDWNVWEGEVAWLTGYFSLAVWTSIAMNYLP
eukprot:scaffold2594_cov85-Cylindrotheca_fusiformis.AAC.1